MDPISGANMSELNIEIPARPLAANKPHQHSSSQTPGMSFDVYLFQLSLQ